MAQQHTTTVALIPIAAHRHHHPVRARQLARRQRRAAVLAQVVTLPQAEMNAITETSALNPQTLGDLVELLRDSIQSGASVGFMLPVSDAELHRYWRGVEREIADGEKHMLVRAEDGVIVGAVQIALCTKTNGVHRAEIQKLLVHSRSRRKGHGRDLMTAAVDPHLDHF